MVQRVRANPIQGIAQDGDGTLRTVTIDPVSLAYLSTCLLYTSRCKTSA